MKEIVWRWLLTIAAAMLILGCGASDKKDDAFLPFFLSDTVALFHFNEGSGNTTSDVSPNLLTASISGGAVWVPGKSGSALSFDNATAEAKANYSGSYLSSSKLTAETWLFANSTCAGNKCLIVGDSFSWLLQLNNGTVEFWINYGLGSDWAKLVSSTAPLGTGAWHHVAATYDGNTAVLYIDGVADATSSGIYTVGDDIYHRRISIGGFSGCCDYINYVQPFPGAIDEVRITKVALSASQIADHYNAL